jgi:hypothetical protein
MPVNYPRFDKKIQDQIDLAGIKAAKTRPGTVMSYDKRNNTVTVAIDDQFSDAIGSVMSGIPCPFTKGVQSVSPTIGTRCLIGFRDNNGTNPYVINFFDDISSIKNYYTNTIVNTGIPRFMVH